MTNVITPLHSDICPFFSICLSLKYKPHTTTSFKQRGENVRCKSPRKHKKYSEASFHMPKPKDKHTWSAKWRPIYQENGKRKEKGTPHRYLLRPYPPSIINHLNLYKVIRLCRGRRPNLTIITVTIARWAEKHVFHVISKVFPTRFEFVPPKWWKFLQWQLMKKNI